MGEGHFNGPEHHGHFAEQNPLDKMSIEAVQADPGLYRNRLMIILEGLPLDQSVKDIQGNQANDLLTFCLDPNSLEDISLEAAFNRVVDGRPLVEETRSLLHKLENAQSRGMNKEIDEDEKIIRRRLFFWVDYLDELLLASVREQTPTLDTVAGTQENTAA